MTTRTLHRWISIVAAVFLLNIAITGTLLAIDELKSRVFGMGPGSPNGPSAPKLDALPAGENLGAMITKIYATAHATVPNSPITMIRLQVQQGEPEALVQYNGADPIQLMFNTDTGALAKYGPPGAPPGTPQALPGGAPSPVSYHQLLKRWHRGDIFGWDGRWMDITAGFSLLFLSVSALKMYVDLLLARRTLGRKRLFWK